MGNARVLNLLMFHTEHKAEWTPERWQAFRKETQQLERRSVDFQKIFEANNSSRTSQKWKDESLDAAEIWGDVKMFRGQLC